MVQNSIIKSQPIPETGRFNWKDGFYNPEKMEAYRAAAERQAAERQQSDFAGRSASNRKNFRGNNRKGLQKSGSDRRRPRR